MKFEQWLYWNLNFSILYQRQAFLSGNMEANVFSPTQADFLSRAFSSLRMKIMEIFSGQVH